MKKEIVEKIKKTKWHADWSNTVPLLDVSFAPHLYWYDMKKITGMGYSGIFVIYKNGVAQGFLPEKEYEKLGAHLEKKLKTVKSARRWSEEFTKLADELYAIIKLSPTGFLKKWEVSEELYGRFGAYAEATKTAFDVLGGKLSEKVRGMLAASRKYSETFFSKGAQIYPKAVSQLNKPKGYANADFLMMTRWEFIQFMESGKIPLAKTLRSRREYCGVYFDFKKNKIIFLNKQETKNIESAWLKATKLKTKNYKELPGAIAFKGKVVGKCKVILDFKGANIKSGDILVTGMTNPNFVPLMKKAGAIVTDGGGLLSHAAIVAREMKKPCIIGTKIATQVLKDGDEVEVDANKGIVKIIKKSTD